MPQRSSGQATAWHLERDRDETRHAFNSIIPPLHTTHQAQVPNTRTSTRKTRTCTKITGKKTPGGAGTHTRDTQAHTRTHGYTDEPHNHPNPTMTGTVNSVPRSPVSFNRYCEGMFSCATPHTRGNAQGEGAMPRDHVGMRRCVCSSDSCAPEKRKCKEVLTWNPRVPARRRAREKCCRR